MRKNKGLNKLEEAILKMVYKRNKIDSIDSIEGLEWDEYGNPIPKQAGENNPDDNCNDETES